MSRASARVFAGLLDRIKRAQARITGGCEDHVCAFADLRQRDLFALPRIIPGSIRDAHIILNDLNLRIRCLGSLFETTFKSVDQTDIHAADETKSARL